MKNQEKIEHIAETYSEEFSHDIDLQKIAVVNDVKKKIIKILSDEDACDGLISDVLCEAQFGPISATGTKRNAILNCAGYPTLEQCDNPRIFVETVKDMIEGVNDVNESTLEDAIRDGIVHSWTYEYCCYAENYWNLEMDDAAKEEVIKLEHIAEIYAEKLFPEMMQLIEDETRKRFEDQQKKSHRKKKTLPYESSRTVHVWIRQSF